MPINNFAATEKFKKEIPLYLQNLLLFMAEQIESHEERHYFELNSAVNEEGASIQKITHVYQYKKEHSHPSKSAVNNKVLIIVEGTKAAIMLADESEK